MTKKKTSTYVRQLKLGESRHIRRKVVSEFHLPSLTEQHHIEECDLNNIVSRFTQTGQFDNRLIRNKQYGEQPTTDQIQEGRYAMAKAESFFQSLSPALQAKYQNASTLLAAIGDPSEATQLASEGILQSNTAIDLPTEVETPETPTPAATEATPTEAIASSEASTSEAQNP